MGLVIAHGFEHFGDIGDDHVGIVIHITRVNHLDKVAFDQRNGLLVRRHEVLLLAFHTHKCQLRHHVGDQLLGIFERASALQLDRKGHLAELGLGGIINIILDPIFMFVLLEPGNEVKGAAIATMLSNVAVLVYFVLIYLKIRKRTVLSLNPRKAVLKRHYVMSVFAVGIPSALGSLLACLSNIVINNLASSYSDVYGDVPVAAIGIAKKIDMLPMNVGMGLCQGMMPLVAYNFASGDHKRMRAFSRTARNTGMAFAGLCILLFQLFAPSITRIFNGHAQTVDMATDFLRILCIAVPFMIFNLQISFSFQAMGMGKQSLILSSLRQGVVNIPLLFLMNHFFGLYGIVWTQLISDIITGIISYLVYRYSLGKLMRDSKMELKEA